jgi:hypothetical protein
VRHERNPHWQGKSQQVLNKIEQVLNKERKRKEKKGKEII